MKSRDILTNIVKLKQKFIQINVRLVNVKRENLYHSSAVVVIRIFALNIVMLMFMNVKEKLNVQLKVKGIF
jgi:hypothetical protein